MSKTGDSVGALYLSLGLDLSTLDTDYIDADRTIQDNMKKLKEAMRLNKLKIDLDNSNINLSEFDKIKNNYEKVNEQIKIQKQLLELAAAEHKKAAAAQGEDSAAAIRKLKAQMNEQKALNNLLQKQMELSQQMKQHEAAQQKPQAQQSILSQFASMMGDKLQGNFFAPILKSFSGQDIAKLIDLEPIKNKFTSLFESIKTKFSGIFSGIEVPQAFRGIETQLLSMFGSLSKFATLAATIPIAITGISYAITQLGEKAAQAGDSVVSLSGRLHTTVKEAGQLKKAMAFVGVDVEDAVNNLIKLDKTVMTADENNDTIRMLDAFDVQLKNTNGTLKTHREQLEELAKGYQKAKSIGLDDEFMTQTVGKAGKSLYDYFDEFEKVNERAANIKGAGILDPNVAHEMAMEYNEMNAQVAAFGAAVGQVFSVAAEPLIRPFIDLFRELVSLIADNKEEIKAFASTIGESLAPAITSCTELLKNIRELTKEFKELTKAAIDFVGSGVLDIFYNAPSPSNIFKPFVSGFDDFNKQQQDNITKLKEAKERLHDVLYGNNKQEKAAQQIDQQEQIRVLDIISGKEKERTEAAKKAAEEAAKAQEQAAKEAAAAHERALKNQSDADSIYYHQKHTEIENQIYDITKARDAQLALAKSTEESSSIMQLAAAKVADVWQKAADKIRGLNESLQEKIFNLTHGAKDKELYQLDKELNSMYKQGADLQLLQEYRRLMIDDINTRHKNDSESSSYKMIDLTQKTQNWLMNGMSGIIDFTNKWSQMPVPQFDPNNLPDRQQQPQDVTYNVNVNLSGVDDLRGDLKDDLIGYVVDLLPSQQDYNINIA